MRVHDEVLDLFIELEADEAQLDAPVVYASARDGTATMDLDQPRHGSRRRCSRRSSRTCRRRRATPTGPFQMLVSTIDHSPYLGRLGDRPHRARHGARRRLGRAACRSTRTQPAEQSRVTKLYTFDGLDRVEVPEAPAGEIVALAGLEGVEIGLTLTDIEHPGAARGDRRRGADDLGRLHREQLALRRQGREVRHVAPGARAAVSRSSSATSRCGSRTPTPPTRGPCRGRGELHLTILMETMRREGYEFQVSRPRVITREGPNGERLEPYEELTIDVPEEYLGVVIEKLGPRRAEMLEMKNPGQGLVRLLYRIPARGLFGYRSEFLTDTRGNGDHASSVPGLRAVGRAVGGPDARVAGVDGERHDRRVRAGQPAGAVDAVRAARRRRCTRG